MKTVFAITIALLLFSAPAFAADVDGKWGGTIMGPMGDINISFTFKADGAKLTGTTVGPDGTELAIKDGKIDGNKISFLISLDFGGMPFDLAYTGVVSPTEIKLTADFGGMPFEFSVKKEK